MNDKDEFLHIKINSTEKARVAAAASELDIPVSQFVREALREKIANQNDQPDLRAPQQHDAFIAQ